MYARCATPQVPLKLMATLSLRPVLVVIMTTPPAAREPYKELDTASFDTFTEAMSVGLMSDNLPLKGTPSTTISALLLAEIEPIPRNTILASCPGWPEELTTCKPATAPSSALDTDVACELLIISFFTLLIEPTKSCLRLVP